MIYYINHCVLNLSDSSEDPSDLKPAAEHYFSSSASSFSNLFFHLTDVVCVCVCVCLCVCVCVCVCVYTKLNILLFGFL